MENKYPQDFSPDGVQHGPYLGLSDQELHDIRAVDADPNFGPLGFYDGLTNDEMQALHQNSRHMDAIGDALQDYRITEETYLAMMQNVRAHQPRRKWSN